MCCITFNDVEPSLHPWDEAELDMVYDHSNMLLDLVCHYFIEDCCISVLKGDWLVLLLCGGVLV
jgi:hypothetical protein